MWHPFVSWWMSRAIVLCLTLGFWLWFVSGERQLAGIVWHQLQELELHRTTTTTSGSRKFFQNCWNGKGEGRIEKCCPWLWCSWADDRGAKALCPQGRHRLSPAWFHHWSHPSWQLQKWVHSIQPLCLSLGDCIQCREWELPFIHHQIKAEFLLPPQCPFLKSLSFFAGPYGRGGRRIRDVFVSKADGVWFALVLLCWQWPQSKLHQNRSRWHSSGVKQN